MSKRCKYILACYTNPSLWLALCMVHWPKCARAWQCAYVYQDACIYAVAYL